MNGQAIDTGKAQARSQGALPLRQGGYIRKTHKGSFKGILQFPGRFIEKLPHHHMVIRYHGIFAHIGSGMLPGIIGESADNDAFCILRKPLPVPAGEKLRNPLVAADSEGTDLVAV